MANLLLFVLVFLTISLHAVSGYSAESKEISYKDYYENSLKYNADYSKNIIGKSELLTALKSGQSEIIDLRNSHEFNKSHISGATNISLTDITEDTLAKNIPSKDTEVIIYCNSSLEHGAMRSRMVPLVNQAYPLIRQLGYHNVKTLMLNKDTDDSEPDSNEFLKDVPFE